MYSRYLSEEVQLDFLRAFRVSWLNVMHPEDDVMHQREAAKENEQPNLPPDEIAPPGERPRCASRQNATG